MFSESKLSFQEVYFVLGHCIVLSTNFLSFKKVPFGF